MQDASVHLELRKAGVMPSAESCELPSKICFPMCLKLHGGPPHLASLCWRQGLICMVRRLSGQRQQPQREHLCGQILHLCQHPSTSLLLQLSAPGTQPRLDCRSGLQQSQHTSTVMSCCGHSVKVRGICYKKYRTEFIPASLLPTVVTQFTECCGGGTRGRIEQQTSSHASPLSAGHCCRRLQLPAAPRALCTLRPLPPARTSAGVAAPAHRSKLGHRSADYPCSGRPCHEPADKSTCMHQHSPTSPSSRPARWATCGSPRVDLKHCSPDLQRMEACPSRMKSCPRWRQRNGEQEGASAARDAA